jgi:hypothetical protein
MKVYERENIYLKYGYSRNPFSLVLEPEKLREVAYQREASRVFNEVVKQEQRVLAVELPESSTLEDEVSFFSFLARTFLLSPDESWFTFEIPGGGVLQQRTLVGFTSIRNRIYEKNAPRIFLSYLLEKFLDGCESGVLGEIFDEDELEREKQKAIETKGASLLEILNYAPEIPKPLGEEATEEEKEEYETRLAEIKKKEEQRDRLRDFYYRLLEVERFGLAVTTAMRSVIQRGIEDAPSNLIPRDARGDLIGILKFLKYSYSNIVSFFINIGTIPFLDDEEIIDYRGQVSELEMIIREFANVLYFVSKKELAIAGPLIEGKRIISVGFSLDFIEKNGSEKELKSVDEFSALVLYMLGAFAGEEIKNINEVAEAAFKAAEGDYIYAFSLLEKAFEDAVLRGEMPLNLEVKAEV